MFKELKENMVSMIKKIGYLNKLLNNILNDNYQVQSTNIKVIKPLDEHYSSLEMVDKQGELKDCNCS